jgi:hypothetical protein
MPFAANQNPFREIHQHHGHAMQSKGRKDRGKSASFQRSASQDPGKACNPRLCRIAAQDPCRADIGGLYHSIVLKINKMGSVTEDLRTERMRDATRVAHSSSDKLVVLR